MERRKQIEVEEQEVRRKEHELESTVRLPAEAESYKIGKVSEGKRWARQQPLTVSYFFFFLLILIICTSEINWFRKMFNEYKKKSKFNFIYSKNNFYI